MTIKRNVSNTGRRDLPLDDKPKDPYLARSKPKDGAQCGECGVLFEKGRWTWPKSGEASSKTGTHDVLCPACQRIADDYPAGWVVLTGAYPKSHRAEIVNLIRNQEALESGEHPLHRIMDIVDDKEEGEIVVTTTDIHLPRRIANALSHAHHGELSMDYLPEDYRVRITWHREA